MARKKIVRPTSREQKRITARLKRKYPQMYETAASPGTRRKLAGLSPGDRKALEKMVGKKLKAIYRSK